MSIKRKKEKKKTFGNLYSPYKSAENSTMKTWFEAYKNDSGKEIEVNGKIYRRIISRAEVYIYDEPTLFVNVEPTDNWYIGEILIDECGRKFEIKHFEMLRYCGNFPEWYLKISNILIQGQDYTIGNYLCKFTK